MDRKSVMMNNTRDIKASREKILFDWIEDLKTSGDWKKAINQAGKLKVAEARRQLYKRETGCSDQSWDNSYFKADHWSQILREEFEAWVVGERSKFAGYDLLGASIAENLNLPLWLDDVPLPEEVMELLKELAEGRKRDKETIKELKNRLEKRDRKILELETRQRNLDQRYLAIEDHYLDSIRTLRYNAGIDIDLSQEDLFESCKLSSS